ncbi:TPA_asm: hypothetical protein [ssRNA phage Gephyllon.1_9]|uniref:Uncharacterized protein n=2 Tax=Norzivirales TaxID=2842247 RepID=A0A8S5L198_9VIRU|nr:hypothetical protein QII62_gp1 [ssRNA phage Gephyllon.1_9]QDH87885.1 MAG: hypothetical protein H1BulkLitter4382_000004 [Leviviridae sp.]DAD51662.1 TPA_asm: hypothetical protein [ssRNA phage Gephyllon.1_9]
MDIDLHRKLAIDVYNMLVAQLNERGILIDTLSSEQLSALNIADIESLNRRYQSILRNPTPRG